MELNQLAFTARYRTPWQVFDLAWLFTKKHFFSMLAIYLLMVLPVAVLLYFSVSTSWAIFLVWWLKPLFERPLLDYLAKQSFSTPVTARQAIGSILKLGFGSIVKLLTINRLTPNRAFLASVEQLEKLKGKPAKQRKMLFLGRFQHKQTWWLLFCVHLEFLITLALGALAISMIPEGIELDSQFVWQGAIEGDFEQIYFLFYVMSISIIAPFFTAGGFFMYLNCRISMEGWDLELAFKRIAQRFSSLAVVIFLGLASFSFAPESYSQTEQVVETKQTNSSTKEQVKDQYLAGIKQQVDDIYQQEQLLKRKKSWLPEPDKKEASMPSWLEGLLSFFRALSHISPLVGYIAWAALIAAVLWLLWRFYLYYQQSSFNFRASVKSQKKAIKEPSLPSFVNDIEQQHWPDDLLLAAEHALNQQQSRQALTYLLRYGLLYIEQQHPKTLNVSMTEQECQQALASKVLPELREQYQTLFQLWIELAWAHQQVNTDSIESLILAFRANTYEVAAQ